jgi:hypothetical protein
MSNFVKTVVAFVVILFSDFSTRTFAQNTARLREGCASIVFELSIAPPTLDPNRSACYDALGQAILDVQAVDGHLSMTLVKVASGTYGEFYQSFGPIYNAGQSVALSVNCGGLFYDLAAEVARIAASNDLPCSDIPYYVVELYWAPRRASAFHLTMPGALVGTLQRCRSQLA